METTSCKDNKNEKIDEVAFSEYLTLQYADVQDATNEIIITTDKELKNEDNYDEITSNNHGDHSYIFGEDTDNNHEEYMENDGDCKEDNEVSSDGQTFMLSTVEEIKKLIKDYGEQTSSRFVAQIKTKNFGLSGLECDLTGHRIQWQDIPHKNSANDIIKFDGIPHICVGHYQFGCEYGSDKKASRKEKRQKMKEDGQSNVKSRNVKNPSKKCGCPAKILVRQIIRFPEFKILKNTEGRKRTGTAKLKERLKTNRSGVQSEMLYIGRLPHFSEHKFHELMEGRECAKEMVHPELIVKAQELFLQDKSNVEIFELIRNYVLNEMFWKQDPPDPKRRRFYPKLIDIRNIVGRIRRLSRFTEEEQESIQTFIEETRARYEDANIIFDVKETCSNEMLEDYSYAQDSSLDSVQYDKDKKERDNKLQTFLFCYQTRSQQWLIRRYCSLSYLVEIVSDLCLKWALAYRMYTLIVQTNLDFQVVAYIIVSKQRKCGLIEGLKCIREWNISWNPDYFLVDYTEEIKEAIASVFPETAYFFNPHSCKNNWMEFLNTPSNDLRENSEELSTCLENMQYALTEESLTIFATLLESSEVWYKSEKLRTWFQNAWLHLANKWVFGYRPDDLMAMQHLKITLDDCLQVHKNILGKSAKTNGFLELIQDITNVITFQEYEKYVKRNNKQQLCYEQLGKTFSFPECMLGLQTSLFPYVDTNLKLAEVNDFIITHDQLGLFTVQLLYENDNESANNVDIDVVNDNYIHHRFQSRENDETNIRKCEIIETEFGSLEYSSKLDAGEYTISFGDLHSYPFCTCTHWKFYKLPCVHMCAVFCKMPGWRYEMFSPLYRSNPIFDIDYACLNNVFQRTDEVCKSHSQVPYRYNGIGENIFESFLKVGANEVTLEHANNLLQHLSKMVFLFKDRVLHSKIHDQLKVYIDQLKSYLSMKDADKQLPASTANVKNANNPILIHQQNKIKNNVSDQAGNKDLAVLCDASFVKINNKLRKLLPKPMATDHVYSLKNMPSNSKSNQLKFVISSITMKAETLGKNQEVSTSSIVLGPNGNSPDVTAKNEHLNFHIATESSEIRKILGKRAGLNLNVSKLNGGKRMKTSQSSLPIESREASPFIGKNIIVNTLSDNEQSVTLSSLINSITLTHSTDNKKSTSKIKEEGIILTPSYETEDVSNDDLPDSIDLPSIDQPINGNC